MGMRKTNEFFVEFELKRNIWKLNTQPLLLRLFVFRKWNMFLQILFYKIVCEFDLWGHKKDFSIAEPGDREKCPSLFSAKCLLWKLINFW